MFPESIKAGNLRMLFSVITSPKESTSLSSKDFPAALSTGQFSVLGTTPIHLLDLQILLGQLLLIFSRCNSEIP